jgi:ABC-2 type transport system permease protein
VVLAVGFRGTGLAIGLGLVYVLVIEQLAVGLPLPDRVDATLNATLIGPNAVALSQRFGDLAFAQMAVDPVASGQAVAVLAAYLAGFLLLTAAIFNAREIT